jgi:cell division protein ZapB
MSTELFDALEKRLESLLDEYARLRDENVRLREENLRLQEDRQRVKGRIEVVLDRLKGIELP